MSKIRLLIAFLGFVILGVALVSVWKSQEVEEWSTTTGTLEFALLQNASSPTVVGASDWGASIGRVRYQYRVQGQDYTGSRVMQLQAIFLPNEAVSSLKPGEIPVYYNPSQPSESYLYATTLWVQITMLTLGAAITFVLALLLPRLLRILLGTASEST